MKISYGNGQSGTERSFDFSRASLSRSIAYAQDDITIRIT